MNVKKPVDYSAMFAALDTLMTEALPQMELYREIGKLVSGRPEKGAAVAAAEYLNRTYPDASGFSPRNLRRMREFYRAYESTPEVLTEAMTIGWTQNVVILAAERTIQERTWYLQAARKFGWSKLELIGMIQERTHETADLDIVDEPCYSNGRRGDVGGTKETSGTFLQGLRDAEVQREFQRQGPCGPHLQSLFPSLTGTTGRADDLRRLENLPMRRLTESEMAWLKNRTHDHLPEVKALACMVYAERFPRLARNQKKQEMSLQTLELNINGEVCDPYGAPVYVKVSYQVSRTPPAIVCV